MIIAGTGHRPDKLGGYDLPNFIKLCRFAITWLRTDAPACRQVISGMAMGWDLALALAAIENDIPFVAAIPCREHECRWSDDWQYAYRLVLNSATETHLITDAPYEPYMMLRRNRWMVDRSDAVCALWNGTLGGTAHCVNYANERGKPVVNIWDQWCAFQ